MAFSTIWKFPLHIDDEQDIPMPAGASVLTVQTQQGTPCLWAMVDPEAPDEIRTFYIYGTGHPLRPDLGGGYVGTFQVLDGTLVFHVWEAERV